MKMSMPFRRIDPITKATTTAVLLALISLGVGLYVILAGGVFNPLRQFRLFWVVLGGVAFYGPGVCFGLAVWGMRTGRRWPVVTGAVAAVLQGLLAVAATVFFAAFARPFSVLPVLEGVLWSAAAFILASQLWRALPWLRADAEHRRGFAVEVATTPAAAHGEG